MVQPFVSVIVPTYQDWDTLLICIESLRSQSYPSDRYEIIVADNNHEEKTQALPEGVKYVWETKPGSYAARNKALTIAQGNIIAFTDSDCIAHQDWLKNGVVAMLSTKIPRIAGHVELFYETNKQSFSEAYEKAFAFNQKKNVHEGTSVTANLFVDRQLFTSVGLFNDSLMSGGDMEWNQRATKQGLAIFYAKDAIIRHPARARLADINKKAKRVTGGGAKRDRAVCKRLIFSVIPPLRLIYALNGRTDLTFRDKFKAWTIAYWLKLYTAFIVLRLALNLDQPARK